MKVERNMLEKRKGKKKKKTEWSIKYSVANEKEKESEHAKFEYHCFIRYRESDLDRLSPYTPRSTSSSKYTDAFHEYVHAVQRS